jgi:hypothetical protein
MWPFGTSYLSSMLPSTCPAAQHPDEEICEGAGPAADAWQAGSVTRERMRTALAWLYVSVAVASASRSCASLSCTAATRAWTALRRASSLARACTRSRARRIQTAQAPARRQARKVLHCQCGQLLCNDVVVATQQPCQSRHCEAVRKAVTLHAGQRRAPAPCRPRTRAGPRARRARAGLGRAPRRAPRRPPRAPRPPPPTARKGLVGNWCC